MPIPLTLKMMNKKYLIGTVPMRYFIFIGTVPMNNLFQQTIVMQIFYD